MIHDITLVPYLPSDRVLSFRWNDETGEFTGIDAVPAHTRFARYIAQGYADIEPYPSVHVFSADPWRTPSDLATAFGAAGGYVLPRVWGEAYPFPPDDPIDDGDTPVTY